MGGCGVREARPDFRTDDARFGRLAEGVFGGELPTYAAACQGWMRHVVARDAHAISHVSFPESDPARACFTPVHHSGRSVAIAAAPPGCAYRPPVARLQALGAELDDVAEGRRPDHRLGLCALGDGARRAGFRHDARAVRALAATPAAARPYAVIIVAGHGVPEQATTAIADWSPGDACVPLVESDLRKLGAMPFRAAVAADAFRGGVAPAIVVTGGAVHSRVIEAFALLFLLQCREGIPPERVLLEPCADHTHTNLRNAGRWIEAIGGRVGYLLTDRWIQSDYFQDSSGFDLFGGSIDQRSLRDFGYVIGSWRQASTGTSRSGFWFTPYRFWAEPREGLGSLTCVDEP